MKRTSSPQSSPRRRWQAGLFVAAGLLLTGLTASEAVAQTAVQQYGQLKVVGNKVVDKNNQPVSLAGSSLFWSNDGWGGEKYYSANTVSWLKNNWNAKLVRVAMGVDESGGYLSNRAGNKQKVKTVVDACLAQGLYVIIDWHSHKAEQHQADAISFFEDMARTYGNTPNVIYEVYNEPLQVSWSNTIKPYAEAVAGAIRAIDPDNLIIVGTPTWSQDVDEAAKDPITRYPNIAYTLHFYAATHKQSLRDKATTALNKGVALFVTEYGTCEASGNGAIDAASTKEWMDFMRQNGISHANWALNDKDETASVLRPGTNPTGSWSDSFLTTSGSLVKGYIQNWNGSGPITSTPPSLPPSTPPSPPSSGSATKVEAESYHTMSGVRTQTTTDTEGGLNVGWLDAGDWMAYTVTVPTAGTYRIDYRVASLNGGGRISLEQNSGATLLGTVNVPKTDDWQQWTTISQTVTLKAGRQDIAIGVPAGGYNINWWSFTRVNSSSQMAPSEATALFSLPSSSLSMGLYPNPAQNEVAVTLPAAGGAVQLTVFDGLGRAVISRSVTGQAAAQQVLVPVEGLVPGTYIVQVTGSNGPRQTYRFVKQ